jgi:hypothetical protein
MAPDSMKNLGFKDDERGPDAVSRAAHAATATPSHQQPQSQTQDKPRNP